MKTRRTASFPTVVGGTTAPKSVRKPRAKPEAIKLAREMQVFEAAKLIEALLPAYVELERTWAKASRASHAFADDHFEPDHGNVLASPHFAALREMSQRNGSDVAQKAMGFLHDKMDRAAKLIEAQSASTVDGIRAMNERLQPTAELFAAWGGLKIEELYYVAYSAKHRVSACLRLPASTAFAR
jgi:hypothetical protein